MIEHEPPPAGDLNAAGLNAMLGLAPEAEPTPETVNTEVAPAEPAAIAGSTPAEVPPPPEPAAKAPEPPAESPAPPTVEAPKGEAFAGYEVIPATKVTRDDGSILLDERFVIRGKGTQDDPYRVPWDLLVSASETFAPSKEKKRLPERITMLDGKWVEISGYIAFPLMSSEADELLVMLNQWDGCCIGVPPTPYDAVEASLAKTVKGQDRLSVEGRVKGRLGVKPHLVGLWLVGVYVMDSAAFSPDRGEAR